jgi:hypothetical protein
MALTRAALEKTLLSRARRRMEFVGMSATFNGDNDDLNDPIATALQRMGIAPADITNIQDGDLATVENILQLIDLAELRLLENIQGNMDAVDIKVGERSENFSQFATSLQKAIDSKSQKIEKEYGMGLGTLSAGVIDMDFQEKGDDADAG